MQKVVLIANIPAPYREKIHELVSKSFNGNYSVIYCAEREENRQWNIQYGAYRKYFLSKTNKNAIHNNVNVFKILKKENPDVIIIMGFFPTMLYAFFWSVLKSKKLIVFTDGTLTSEHGLSFIHRMVRKLVFSKTKAFIGTANGSASLYASYGIDSKLFFRTYLCANNTLFYTIPLEKKKYDIMFSGQFIERKMPFFFIEIAELLKSKKKDLKVLIIGDGILKEGILKRLNEVGIDYDYPGFIGQEHLQKYYALSKIFLFPTLNDPWGVVANEAMAAGVPVVTCANAGVANDLVLHDKNGYVLPLKKLVWMKKIEEILNDPVKYDMLSSNAKKHVNNYNYKNAAQGIVDAVCYVSS